MDRNHSFGYWLRRRRKALDLTQAELAQRASCSLDLIQKIEADARRPSRQMAEKLANVLGIEPSERAAFIQAARAERSADQLDLATHPVEQPQRSTHTNLPAQLTALIGREREVSSVVALLRRAEVRLVTLSGPGGIGKTRLSLEVAAELLDDFTHGVYFVDLAPIREPNLVIGQIATALGVKEIGAQPLLATLKEYLRDRQMLLLLDNFEQVIDAAPLITQLLGAAAQLKVLVTSREVLKLRGEKEVAVPPLALPDPAQLPSLDQLSQYAAVALLIKRALDVRPNFAVTNANAPAVAEICARLDGLPLAIELAAARLKLFPPEALLARLSDRLAMLTGGPRDLPARQQTIRSTIAWSCDLLNEDEQGLFRRLGVFVGGWTLEAAEAVCASQEAKIEDRGLKIEGRASIFNLPSSILDLLAALLDKSLIHQKQDASTPRFTMLETVREYALEQLEASGEAERLRREHARYYLTFGEEQWSREGVDIEMLVSSLQREYDNLISALAWSQTTAGEPETALRLANVIDELWNYRGVRVEAIAAFERALSHPLGVGRTQAHAYARTSLASTLFIAGHYAAAQHHFDQALQLARELGMTELSAQILHWSGLVARERGDAATAWSYLSESLALWRTFGAASRIVQTLNSLAGTAILEEDSAGAEALLAESRAVADSRSLNDENVGWTLNHLGLAAQLRGEHDRARRLHEQSLAYFPASYHAGWQRAYHSLGEIALSVGHLAEAADWLRPALEGSWKVSDQEVAAWCLAGMGSVAALNEQPERAARLWGAAERLRQSIGCRPAPAARATYEQAIALAHAQVGEQVFAAAWAAGQALTLEQAIAEALGDPE